MEVLPDEGVSGDEGELAEGDAVGPEPVRRLLDEEFEGLQARFDRAGGGVELGAGHEAAFGEGVQDAMMGTACAFEREAAGSVGDVERGDHGVVVGGTVEPAGVGAGAAGDAAAEGALEAVDVGPVVRWEEVRGNVAFGHGSGSGLCSHADMVGRAALSAQRARVTGATRIPGSLYSGGLVQGLGETGALRVSLKSNTIRRVIRLART